MKVGFIGLGIMGHPMAGNLQKGGHTLFLYAIRNIPDDLLSAGATKCGSGKEAASQADVIITMVPDTPHVESALFGKDGVAEGLAPEPCEINRCRTVQEFAAAAAAADVILVDSHLACGRDFMEQSPRLRAVISPIAGIEQIDLKAANELG